jgi:hypothetical protein
VTAHERQVASEAKAMTKLEVIGKALEGRISWIDAAAVLGVSARHLRRLREDCAEGQHGRLRPALPAAASLS